MPKLPIATAVFLRSALLWFLTATLTAWVLSWCFATLPPRARPLAVLPVAFGMAVAWAAARLGESLALKRTPLLLGALMTLAALGYGHVIWRGFDDYRIQKQAAMPSGEQLLALQMLRQSARGDPDLARRYENELMSRNATWDDFLQQRVRGLGHWPAPWPRVFAAGELLLAGSAALAAGLWLWTSRGRIEKISSLVPVSSPPSGLTSGEHLP